MTVAQIQLIIIINNNNNNNSSHNENRNITNFPTNVSELIKFHSKKKIFIIKKKSSINPKKDPSRGRELPFIGCFHAEEERARIRSQDPRHCLCPLSSTLVSLSVARVLRWGPCLFYIGDLQSEDDYDCDDDDEEEEDDDDDEEGDDDDDCKEEEEEDDDDGDDDDARGK